MLPHAPSSSLLSAALAGLLGIGAPAGCANRTSGNQDSSGVPDGRDGGRTTSPPASADAGTDAGAYSHVLSTTPITFEAFSDLCEKRGGFVTTNANCAGSNLCRGLSYEKDGSVLTEHSCKGMNSCAGMSCVELPKGSGLTGEEIYESGPCGGCHNDAITGRSTYVVFVPQGADPSEALSAFEIASDLKLESIVAFGTEGVNANGVEYSNMPSYRDRYSRAEIESVVAYVRGLKAHTKVYEIPGESFDAGRPDGGGACSRLAARCSPRDPGSGRIHDCAQLARAGDENACAGQEGSCESACSIAPPDGSAAQDAGTRDAAGSPTDGGGGLCEAIGAACAYIDPGVGPVHDCTVLRDAPDPAVCSADYEGCRSLCGASICVRLGSICHDVDPGDGPIHDCHMGGHAGIADWCFDNAVHCYSICEAAAAGQP
jgi:hypothetical protein